MVYGSFVLFAVAAHRSRCVLLCIWICFASLYVRILARDGDGLRVMACDVCGLSARLMCSGLKVWFCATGIMKGVCVCVCYSIQCYRPLRLIVSIQGFIRDCAALQDLSIRMRLL